MSSSCHKGLDYLMSCSSDVDFKALAGIFAYHRDIHFPSVFAPESGSRSVSNKVASVLTTRALRTIDTNQLNPKDGIRPKKDLALGSFVVTFKSLAAKVSATLSDTARFNIPKGLVAALSSEIELLMKAVDAPDATTADILPARWLKFCILVDALSESTLWYTAAKVSNDNPIRTVDFKDGPVDLDRFPDALIYSFPDVNHVDVISFIKNRPKALFKNYPRKKGFFPGACVPINGKNGFVYGNFHPFLKFDCSIIPVGILRYLFADVPLKKRILLDDPVLDLKIKNSSVDPVRFCVDKLSSQLKRGDPSSLKPAMASVIEKFEWKPRHKNALTLRSDSSLSSFFYSQSNVNQDGDGLASLVEVYINTPKSRKPSVVSSNSGASGQEPTPSDKTPANDKKEDSQIQREDTLSREEPRSSASAPPLMTNNINNTDQHAQDQPRNGVGQMVRGPSMNPFAPNPVLQEAQHNSSQYRNYEQSNKYSSPARSPPPRTDAFLGNGYVEPPNRYYDDRGLPHFSHPQQHYQQRNGVTPPYYGGGNNYGRHYNNSNYHNNNNNHYANNNGPRYNNHGNAPGNNGYNGHRPGNGNPGSSGNPNGGGNNRRRGNHNYRKNNSGNRRFAKPSADMEYASRRSGN